VNGQALDTGDAALLSAESRITVSEGRQAEVLVFDLAP
nr:quercetin 2,3-dioxygenase [Burkholderiaceae bacterium]